MAHVLHNLPVRVAANTQPISSPHRLMTLLTRVVTTLAVCKHCKLTSLGPIIDNRTEAFVASLCKVQAFWFDHSAKLLPVLHMAWSAGHEGK
jgi:hypothetical protein